MVITVDELQRIVDTSNNIVFFGGAGVSTASGIPDYRSKEGLYNKPSAHPPETILSRSFFDSHTEEFFEYYRNHLIHIDAKPNEAHRKLAELERAGKLKAVITQNVDGLHQKAGSRNVFELHGSMHRNFCERCGRFYELSWILEESAGAVPCCSCGGIVKPAVVLYGEQLEDQTVNGAVRAIQNAEVLIVGGTSLSVYPAAGLLEHFQGNALILIDKQNSAYAQADGVSFLQGDIARLMGYLTVVHEN